MEHSREGEEKLDLHRIFRFYSGQRKTSAGILQKTRLCANSSELRQFFRFLDHQKRFALLIDTLDAIDYRRNQIVVRGGKGAKDRVVYISNDAADALARYLRRRIETKEYFERWLLLRWVNSTIGRS